MSERSFQRHRALGIAGQNTKTCLPQAFDRIVPESAVSSYTYAQYRKVMSYWDNNPSHDVNPGKHNGIYRELYDLIAGDLGGISCKDMVFEYAFKAGRLARVLDNLFENGMRPVIDVNVKSGVGHAAGVRQVDEGLYWLVGYGVPTTLRGRPVTALEIEPFHTDTGFTENRLWPFVGKNISALPPKT